MYHEMKVFGLALDPLTQRPLVILKDLQEQTSVPVWISNMEVVAIAAELISRDIASQSGRVDLLSVMMQEMGIEIKTILMESLNDGTITATINFIKGEEEVRVNVRPSEALIMALKHRFLVKVSDEVVVRASLVDMNDDAVMRESNARRYADFLDNLDPADMGKYPM